jgi:GTP pyrophosphokinase/guanosine-3',5'-bis(diphosphate) 3'-pyrophosphohydrolase
MVIELNHHLKNQSPSLHWIPITKTGKARAAIRRYWHERGEKKE